MDGRVSDEMWEDLCYDSYLVYVGLEVPWLAERGQTQEPSVSPVKG